MLDTFMSIDFLGITTVLLKVFLVYTLLMSVYFSYRYMSIPLVLFFPIKNNLDIVNNATEHNNYKMAVTKADLLWFISKVNSKNPSYLNKLTRVYLTDRPIGVGQNVLGAYYPHETEGRVIHLYPTKFDEKENVFYLENYDKKTRIGFNSRQMKENLLSTLGHEIGHNVAYDKTEQLSGENIENFCDQFSKNLYLVEDRLLQGKKYESVKE